MNKEIEFKVHRNINFKPKMFGIFEKKSFTIIMIIAIILLKILDFFKVKSTLKLEIMILFLVPNLLFSANTLMYENPIYIVKYLLKYLFSKKVYLYEREYMKSDNYRKINKK